MFKVDDPENSRHSECDHDYEQVYQGWESETYQCKKCKDRYKLYYEDMM